MNLRVWVRHLDNFASLASAGLSLPTLRSHRHSPGASSCRQTRIIALSAIVSQYPVNPLYTRASPLLQVTQHLEKEGIHSATPTKSHTTHKDSITPSLQQSLSSYSPTHHQVSLGIAHSKADTSYIQPHDSTVSQRPTGPVLHNGRKVGLTGFDTVPADLVILLGLILESRRNATQLT